MSDTSAAKQDPIEAERERRCLRFGLPYPLGDCSD